MIHLIYNRYESDRPERQAELDICRERNEALYKAGLISKITEITDGRPTFGEMFALCDDNYINVLSNSDIFFDASIVHLNRLRPRMAYALSRHDVTGWMDGQPLSSLYDHADSQDVWAIKGRPSAKLLDIDYTMGVPGCDNRLCHDLRQAGYRVANPARIIRCHHLHLTGYRTYQTRPVDPVPPPYAFVKPQ